jgi:hypothetical protein
MKSDVGLQIRPSPYPLSGKTNPFDMETAEQLLEKLNRQFRAGEPAAVLLRTLTALENAIRHTPPRVRDMSEDETSAAGQQLPPAQPVLSEPDPVIQMLEVDEAEIEEELRALREAAELRQIRQQHLRPDLSHLNDDEPGFEKNYPVPSAGTMPHASTLPMHEPMPVQAVAPVPSTPMKPATELNDAMSDRASSLNDRFRSAGTADERPKFLEPIPDIRKAIGINDRFRFVNDLFSGDAEAFSITIGLVNESGSYADARRMLEMKIREKGSWQPDHPSLKELLHLLERRYS